MTIVVLLFSPCLFNLLVRFVSFSLQQFAVRHLMPQGIQPIPTKTDPDLYKFLKQSVRDFFTSSVQPMPSSKKVQKRPSTPVQLGPLNCLNFLSSF